jgi:hypothetical protein
MDTDTNWTPTLSSGSCLVGMAQGSIVPFRILGEGCASQELLFLVGKTVKSRRVPTCDKARREQLVRLPWVKGSMPLLP